jgi:hypothetical protein
MMTINKSKEFLKTLLNDSTNKKEIRVYKKFLLILNGLERRNLSINQKELIEQELTSLKLEQKSQNRKKYIQKKSTNFVKFLESEFSFVLKGHYANYGLTLGMVLGVAIGSSILSDSGGATTGMCLGMFIGYILGRYKDEEAVKKNKVLIVD